MPPKRPAGLGAASKAKKNKQEDGNNGGPSQVQPPAAAAAQAQEEAEDEDEWEDLLELWDKCVESLQSGCIQPNYNLAYTRDRQ